MTALNKDVDQGVKHKYYRKHSKWPSLKQKTVFFLYWILGILPIQPMSSG